MPEIIKDTCGLVLQGGGGKGAYQAGAFQALYEMGFTDKIIKVAGSSVGALNACLFAYPDKDIAKEIWHNISNSQILTEDLDLIDFKEGLFSRQGLIDTMDGYLDLSLISGSKTGLYATVTKYNDDSDTEGEAVYVLLNGLENEMIKKVLLASSCMPIIYEPVEINGKKYRDGGLTDNLPIEPLYECGIREFIVILLDKDADVPEYRYPDAKFFVIRPTVNLGDLFDGTLDFSSKGAKIRYEIGYKDTLRYINYYEKSKEEMLYLAELENERIKDKMKIYNSEERINENLEKFNDLLGKYGI